MIILKDGEVDVADKEAINLLRWMRRHHLSIRALKGCMRTTCTWDAVGKLNDQVKKLEAEGGIEIGGTPKKLLCFKSGDGNVMMSGSCGKCWNCNLKYDHFQAHLFAIADFPVLPRIGSLMSCIPPVRNVGDVANCCARVGTGIGKRLKDSARTWGSPGALRAVSRFFLTSGKKQRISLWLRE